MANPGEARGDLLTNLIDGTEGDVFYAETDKYYNDLAATANLLYNTLRGDQNSWVGPPAASVTNRTFTFKHENASYELTVDIENTLKVGIINEHTLDAGVTIETVLIKDGEVDGVDISAHAHTDADGTVKISYNDLNNIPSTFTPSAHEMVDSVHTDSSLTVGHVIRASGAAAFAWAQLDHSDLSGVPGSNPHSIGWSDVSVGHIGTAHNSISVTDLSDVTGVGSGIIISGAERTGLHSEGHVLATTGPHTGSLPLTDLDSWAQGRIVIGGATDWTHLVLGTENYVLKAGASEPAWAQLDHSELSGLPGSNPHSIGWSDVSVGHDGSAHSSISVTDLSDVTGVGSGIIISGAERTGLHPQSHTMASHSDDDTYSINTSGTFTMGAAAEDLDMGNFDLNNVTDIIIKGVLKLYDSVGPYTSSFAYTFGSDVNGAGIIVQPGGCMILGSGESASSFQSGGSIAASTEVLYLTSDNSITFVTNMQAGYASRKTATLSTAGILTVPNVTIGSIVADDSTYTGLVTSDSGVLKYRTKAQVLGDIAASPVVGSASIVTVGTVTSGTINTSVLSPNILGAPTGAPDAWIWRISGDYPTYGIFYNTGTPDYLEVRWDNVAKFKLNMETGAIVTGTIPWGNVSGKPTTFTPISHGYSYHSDINQALLTTSTPTFTDVRVDAIRHKDYTNSRIEFPPVGLNEMFIRPGNTDTYNYLKLRSYGNTSSYPQFHPIADDNEGQCGTGAYTWNMVYSLNYYNKTPCFLSGAISRNTSSVHLEYGIHKHVLRSQIYRNKLTILRQQRKIASLESRIETLEAGP